MSSNDKRNLRPSSRSEVDHFLRQVAATPSTKRAASGGRLIFAMDATASREPTWDTACQIQSEMFSETASLGGLSLQLCYYRGFREFHASEWVDNSASLVPLMTSVFCLGGHTQIERVLRHALAEQKRRKLDALVFVGDCMEEDADKLCALAGELGLLGVPIFLFHEGLDGGAGRIFQQLARLSRGAYCRFDSGSAEQLKALLSAVAVYAAGGRRALEDFGKSRGGVVRQLTHQVGKNP
jgi:hypothetical protein